MDGDVIKVRNILSSSYDHTSLGSGDGGCCWVLLLNNGNVTLTRLVVGIIAVLLDTALLVG